VRRSGSRRPDLFLASLGEVLRRLRKQTGMSQHVLSIEAGLASNAVGDLERGNRAIQAQELVWICNALSIPVPRFLEEVTAAAQIKAVLPIEGRLRKSSRGRRPKHDEPREVEVVIFRVGGIRAKDGLNTWIETLRSLIPEGS
jgi:transcriptional regulator with XRE-family HTH domain